MLDSSFGCATPCILIGVGDERLEKNLADTAEQGPLVIGRYVLLGVIASGGMAKVHYGRLLGSVGFSRVVAIKRLHDHFAADPDFVAMFVDEARLASRVRHPNVVPTLDVVTIDQEILLILDYVEGEVLARLLRYVRSSGKPVPLSIASAIVSGALRGLHAAHEAKDEEGNLLGLVHRDVSPHNIIVGVDGVPRMLDFGVAKAVGRMHGTRDGQLKGKLAYMSPEQIRGEVTRASDVFAASVVLWETLTGRELFGADNEGATLNRLLNEPIALPSSIRSDVPPELDALVMRGLERDPADRFATAEDMARALQECVTPAFQTDLGRWVAEIAAKGLAVRSGRIVEIESSANRFLSNLDPSQLALAVRDDPVVLGPRDETGSASVASIAPGREASMSLPHPAKKSWRTAAVLAITLLALVIVLAVVWTAPSKSVPKGLLATGSAAVLPSASLAAAPASSPAASVSAAASASAEAPSSSAIPAVTTAIPAVRVPARTKPRPAPSAPKPGPDCSQPSYRDENGIVRYKVECL